MTNSIPARLLILRIGILSALLLFFSVRVSAQQSVWYGRCVGVSDGDTIKVLTVARQQLRVRIAFIDAPEKGQAFGQRAKQAMSELVFGHEVEFRPHTIDRYGRLVARVFVEGRDADLELIKEGFCSVYEKYVGQASAEIQLSYRDAQAAAQSEKAGLWRDPEPVPPWEWRKEKSATPQPQSSNARIIGKPSWLILESARRTF